MCVDGNAPHTSKPKHVSHSLTDALPKIKGCRGPESSVVVMWVLFDMEMLTTPRRENSPRNKNSNKR